MNIFVIVGLSVISAILLVLCSYKSIQILQLSSYRVRGIFSWLKKTKYDYLFRYFSLAFFSFTSSFVFTACFSSVEYLRYVGFLFYIALALAFTFNTRKERKKTPLIYTPRIKRLYIVLFIFFVCLSFISLYVARSATLLYSICAALPILIVFIVIAAHYFMLPLEHFIGRRFIKKAVKKLNAVSPKVIGITGSYGKTTAKNILNTFLADNFKVLATEKSFNTPLGIARSINENLNDDCQIFIAEMGARYVGDIKELCDIVHPEIGIITSIGNQHLETFKTEERVFKTKCELIDGAHCTFVNGYDAKLKVLDGENIAKTGESSRVSFKDAESSINGTSFTLCIDSKDYQVTTVILGEHVPELICVCAAVALELGVKAEDIAEKVQKLPQTPHRLEVLNNGSIMIVDDSYNANPIGAENALKIIGGYKGKKIIVTPGFVELGAKQDEENFKFGQKIAKIFDYAFFVGSGSKQLLLGAEMMGEQAKMVDSLEEAMSFIRALGITEVAILFENDLPDNY